MTYPELNGTLVGSDILQLFVYANTITNNLFIVLFMFAFFIIVSLGSMFMQFRFSVRIRPEVSILAGSFATFGLAVILEQVSGLLSPKYFFIIISIMILSAVWTFFNND